MKRILTLLFSLILLLAPLHMADSASLYELNNKLDFIRDKNQKLEENIKYYSDKIIALQDEVTTIQGQLELIDLEIELTKESINKSIWEISKIEKNIDVLEANITELKKNIETQKNLLIKLINILYEEQQAGEGELLYILLSSENINDILNRLEYLTIFEKEAHTVLESLQSNEKILQEQIDLLDNEKNTQKAVLKDFRNKETTLTAQENGKEELLRITQGKAELFDQLKAQAEEERKRIEEEINNITSDIHIEKERLNKLREKTSLQGFQWPIPPDTITAPFRDAGYAVRFGRQHNGVDIRAAAGTEITSPKDGIVVKVVPPTSKKLSYLIIDHGGVQTVYLHLSQIFVEEGQDIVQGQVVAATGGIPGANGTGIGLSTGPHLHFEIREEGSAVDPLLYLP